MTYLVQSESRAVAPPRRIVLTGFMGSGKTTVGPLVAARLGWRFVDVDDVIEAEAGATIAELFTRHGESRLPRSGALRPSPGWPPKMRWCWPSAAAQSRELKPAICC